MGFALISGSARQPRLRVLANGVAISGATDVGISATSHFSADRFFVRVATDPLSLQPPGLVLETAIFVDVQVNLADPLSGVSWTSLVQGNVDTLELDPLAGTLRLAGRDLTAALIEARTQETFSNHTSSEVATLLAARHGLSALVTATSTPIGRYYQIEHDRITLDQFSQARTEWDLLVWLAEREGFDVWVAGTTLYFAPPSPATDAVVIRPEMLTELRVKRALTLLRPVAVTVKSRNSRQQTTYSETVNSAGAGAAAQYVYVRPNLSPGEALAIAQQRLTDITAHVYTLVATMTGDVLLTPRCQLALSSTGTAFDQTYVVDSIERRLAVRGGFTQRLRARTVFRTR